MSTLDKIREMQQKGMSEPQIIQNLREQGLSETEINQALEQSKIKAAIAPENTTTPVQETQTTQPQKPITQETDAGEMQPSVMTKEPMPLEQPIQPTPGAEQTAEQEAQQYAYPTPQAYYPGYEQYQPYESSTEIMTEISEQVVEEKLDKIKKQIDELLKFKTIAENKTKDINERLKKIEAIIDRLQAAIIGRIGTYGQNIEDIKKEMELMQQSFSKALPSLIEKEKVKKSRKKKKTLCN